MDVGRALILLLFAYTVTGDIQLWSVQSTTGCSSAQVSAKFNVSRLISYTLDVSPYCDAAV